jgi:hypothetical protein
MNWFRANPVWGAITLATAIALLIALGLFWMTKGKFDAEKEQYLASVSNLRQLEASNPYPSAVNVRKIKTYLETYRTELDKMKNELKRHVLPITPLPPNEFQMHLREAMTATAANARVHRVKLPENFNLGFPEYIAALPSTPDAPKLGQELTQIQLLLSIMIEARVDAIKMFRRVPREVNAPAASNAPTPRGATGGSAPKAIERNVVEFAISASPVAARKVINEISAADEQFFIIRSLHVKNQKEKGPPRESGTSETANPTPNSATNTTAATAATPSPTSSAPPSAALNFIVGNEHIDVSARVDMVNFTP